MACLFIDMFFNKIKMNRSHIKVTIAINVGYILISLIFDKVRKTPVYIDNLNWYCESNHSYLYETNGANNKKPINQEIYNDSCYNWHRDPDTINQRETYTCKDVSNRIYCPDISEDEEQHFIMLGYAKWNLWRNAGFLATLIILTSIVVFYISFYIHEFKMGDVKPYLGI